MLILFKAVPNAYRALADGIYIHANSAWAGVKRLQRVGREHMPTALWPQAYAEYVLANN